MANEKRQNKICLKSWQMMKKKKREVVLHNNLNNDFYYKRLLRFLRLTYDLIYFSNVLTGISRLKVYRGSMYKIHSLVYKMV